MLDSYLAAYVELGYASTSNYVFPCVCGKLTQVSQSTLIQIQIPFAPVTYDNFRNPLKNHLDCKELMDMGVHLEDYSTHSFRLGGLSVIVDDKVVTLAFLKKSAHLKRWDSTVSYIKPSLPLALRANDLLSGNQPAEG